MTKIVPEIKGMPFLGVINEFSSDRIGFIMRAARDYGDVVRYQFAVYSAYQLNDPDLIHQALVAQASKFTKSILDHQILGRSLGTGLLISEGELHTRQRKLMQPAFHHKRIAAYADVMVELTEEMIREWRDGQRFDMHHAMTELTRKIVLATLFGKADDLDDIGETIEMINEVGGAQYGRGFVFPLWLPVPENRRSAAAIRKLDTALQGIINERRKSKEDRGDLLSMLLLAQDEESGTGMSDAQVRYEAITLFAAGHETTANALAWTVYLLTQHPEVAAKLRREVDGVLAGRTPTLDDLGKLPYTDMVIKEGMRLYPPAWILNGRTATEDINLGEYVMPKGATAYVSPYVMHHQERYFPEPDAFKPERWANDFEKTIPRYAYFPFGGGPRVCIGNSFAMMEARLVLAMMVSAGVYDLQPGAQIEMNPLVTLRPKYGVPVTVKLRQPETNPVEAEAVPA